MMWFSVILFMLRASSEPAAQSLYWQIVNQDRRAGCSIVNYVYESCPDADGLGAIPIPDGAMVLLPIPPPRPAKGMGN